MGSILISRSPGKSTISRTSAFSANVAGRRTAAGPRRTPIETQTGDPADASNHPEPVGPRDHDPARPEVVAGGLGLHVMGRIRRDDGDQLHRVAPVEVSGGPSPVGFQVRDDRRRSPASRRKRTAPAAAAATLRGQGSFASPRATRIK